MALNPIEALPTLFQGLWKEYTSGEDGIAELRIAPHVQQGSSTGQYQVLNTRAIYNAQLSNADGTSYDGTPNRYQSLEYDTLTTQLRPFRSIPVKVTDSILRMLESENPNLGVLNSALMVVKQAIEGRMAAEIVTEVAGLTSGGTIDLSTSTTDVGRALLVLSDDILEATGTRPNHLAFGPRAANRMKTTNTKIGQYVGVATTGGALSGVVSDDGLRRYFREVVGCEITIISRATTPASGTTAFQWNTSGAFVRADGGDMPSCLKTCAPDAELFRVYVETMPAYLGGPAQVFSAMGELDVVTADTNLGRLITWTL